MDMNCLLFSFSKQLHQLGSRGSKEKIKIFQSIGWNPSLHEFY